MTAPYASTWTAHESIVTLERQQFAPKSRKSYDDPSDLTRNGSDKKHNVYTAEFFLCGDSMEKKKGLAFFFRPRKLKRHVMHTQPKNRWQRKATAATTCSLLESIPNMNLLLFLLINGGKARGTGKLEGNRR
jgi:hypothetical protein